MRKRARPKHSNVIARACTGENAKAARVILADKARDVLDALVLGGALQMHDEAIHRCFPCMLPRM